MPKLQSDLLQAEPMLSVQPLARLPGLKPVVSGWLLSEWPGWYGEDGAGDLAGDIHSFAASEHTLPVGLVAFLDEEPVGFASLKRASIPTHAHLLPWAASGYVVPGHRGQGVGAFLLKALCAHAAVLGYGQVYCGTSTAANLLLRKGWAEIEQIAHAGQPLGIFRSGALALAHPPEKPTSG